MRNWRIDVRKRCTDIPEVPLAHAAVKAYFHPGDIGG
jgi:hypothetical protein